MLPAVKRFVKQQAIRAGLEGVSITKAGRFFPGAAGRGVIFTLHHVRPERSNAYDPNALLSVTPEFLDAAIRMCRDKGLTPVALEDLPALLAERRDERRFVSFTLDDGYRNNAEHAAPVFRRHGVAYTIFITKGFAERWRSMWWETAKALTRKKDEIAFDFGDGPERLIMRGHKGKTAAFHRFARFIETVEEDEAVARLDAAAREAMIDPLAIVDQLVMTVEDMRELAKDPLARFGAHTLTHVNLKRVSPERLAEEMRGSAEAVSVYVDRRPTCFAYPYGFAAACGEREFMAAAAAGFAAAVTTQPGVLRPEDSARPTALHRVSLNGLYQKPRYVEALLSGVPFKLM